MRHSGRARVQEGRSAPAPGRIPPRLAPLRLRTLLRCKRSGGRRLLERPLLRDRGLRTLHRRRAPPFTCPSARSFPGKFPRAPPSFASAHLARAAAAVRASLNEISNAWRRTALAYDSSAALELPIK